MFASNCDTFSPYGLPAIESSYFSSIIIPLTRYFLRLEISGINTCVMSCCTILSVTVGIPWFLTLPSGFNIFTPRTVWDLYFLILFLSLRPYSGHSCCLAMPSPISKHVLRLTPVRARSWHAYSKDRQGNPCRSFGLTIHLICQNVL